jgi:hypothetical protein
MFPKFSFLDYINMQVGTEHALSDKQKGRDPISCITTQLLFILHGYNCTHKWFTVTHISYCHVFVLIIHSEICFTFPFTVLKWDGEIYIWRAGFLYDTYVKNKICISCKTRICHKHPGVPVSATLTIFKLVKKVCSTNESFINKYTRQNITLTTEKDDEIGAIFENSPCKSVTWFISTDYWSTLSWSEDRCVLCYMNNRTNISWTDY